MRKHTRAYLDYFGYGEEDFICCEVCGRRAVDIHHIKARGMGGSKNRDHISNLMALDRECHERLGDKKQYIDFLRDTHEEFMKRSKFA
jgi:hypothetical protein